MKTKNFLIVVTLIIACFMSNLIFGQVTQDNNFPIFGNYVGFDASSGIALPIRNDGPSPIEFWTNGNQHMELRADGTFGFGNIALPGKVGIHVDQPTFANSSTGLYVRNDATGNIATYAGNFETPGFANTNIAIRGSNQGQSYATGHMAGSFLARNWGDFLYGVRIETVANNFPSIPCLESTGLKMKTGEPGAGAVDRLYGIYSQVTLAATYLNYGIYSEAPAWTSANPVNLAGFFNGSIAVTGSYNPSDENLKSNVQQIESATSVLNELNPVKYNYSTQGRLHFEDRLQYGFLAQEVEEVLPELVRTLIVPAEFDSTGTMVEDDFTFKGLSYNDFIAILTAGFQEQSSIITSQEAQLSALESQIATQSSQLVEIQASLEEALMAMNQAKSSMENCCQDKSTGSVIPVAGSMYLGQNVPNPFDQQTRIDFTLQTDAHVVLEISDSNGRKLERLIDGNLGAGSHSTLWDGSRHSPGMYYYSLFANGKLLTKKMIKR